jgi:hypothetical protein
MTGKVTVTTMLTADEFRAAATRVMALQGQIDSLTGQRTQLIRKAKDSLPLTDAEFGAVLDAFDELSRKIRVLADELAAVTTA